MMEIHFRAIVIGKKQMCWFITWDLSQVVQNIEIILATVLTKSSKADITCLEKVHNSELQVVCTHLLNVFSVYLDLLYYV